MKCFITFFLILFLSISIESTENFGELFLNSYENLKNGNYDKCLEFYEMLLGQDVLTESDLILSDSNLEDYFENYMVAILNYELENYEKSLFHFKKSFEYNSELLISLIFQYYCYHNLGLTNEKKEVYQILNNWKADNASDLIDRFDFYVEIDEIDKAHNDLQKLKDYSKFNVYNLKLSKYYFNCSDFSKALNEIEKVLIECEYKNDRYKVVNYRKVCVLFKLGKKDAAISLLKDNYALEQCERDILAIITYLEFFEDVKFLKEEKTILKKLFNEITKNYINSDGFE